MPDDILDHLPLDTLSGLLDALLEPVMGAHMDLDDSLNLRPFICGSVFCRRCGGPRRVKIHFLGVFQTKEDRAARSDLPALSFLHIGIAWTPLPAFFLYQCVMCDEIWAVMVYASPAGSQMVLFPAHSAGGVATAHTPAGVAFYLDQAARSHCVGAHSAAVTMFRSALEWLLLDQGFPQNMLGPKLKALDAALAAGTAPKWASELNAEFLHVIRQLGNTATHTNAGDLAKQDALDADLYHHVETTFVELLDTIYESPKRKEKRLLELKRPLAKGTV